MKVLFGIDITENKNNEFFNGVEFITASNTAEELFGYEKATEKLGEISRSAEIPKALEIIMILAFLAGNITLAGIFFGSLKVGISQAFSYAPYAFFICPAAFIIYFIIFAIRRNKQKKVCEDPQTASAVRNAENTNQELYYKLGVPDDAPTMDVLMFFYKLKKGNAVMYEKDLNAYTNFIMRVFITDTSLCFSDISNVYSVPLEDIRNIRTVDNKVICMATWNKDDPYTDKKYKKYDIKENNVGLLWVKGYCVLEFEHDGEDWEVWFPPYEEETIRDLLSKI